MGLCTCAYMNFEPHVLNIMKRALCQTSLFNLGVKKVKSGGSNAGSTSAHSSSATASSDRTSATASSAEGQELEEGPGNQDEETEPENSATVAECESDCCKPDREGPNQPTSNKILAATKRVQSQQARYVQSSWFTQHPWLTL